jgi:hypothetical protein
MNVETYLSVTFPENWKNCLKVHCLKKGKSSFSGKATTKPN